MGSYHHTIKFKFKCFTLAFHGTKLKLLNLILHIVNIGTWFPCSFIDVITLPMNKVKLVSPYKFRIKNFFNFIFFIAMDFHRRWQLWSSKNEWILVRFKKKKWNKRCIFIESRSCNLKAIRFIYLMIGNGLRHQ
jgi:hypothetical protein